MTHTPHARGAAISSSAMQVPGFMEPTEHVEAQVTPLYATSVAVREPVANEGLAAEYFSLVRSGTWSVVDSCGVVNTPSFLTTRSNTYPYRPLVPTSRTESKDAEDVLSLHSGVSQRTWGTVHHKRNHHDVMIYKRDLWNEQQTKYQNGGHSWFSVLSDFLVITNNFRSNYHALVTEDDDDDDEHELRVLIDGDDSARNHRRPQEGFFGEFWRTISTAGAGGGGGPTRGEYAMISNTDLSYRAPARLPARLPANVDQPFFKVANFPRVGKGAGDKRLSTRFLVGCYATPWPGLLHVPERLAESFLTFETAFDATTRGAWAGGAEVTIPLPPNILSVLASRHDPILSVLASRHDPMYGTSNGLAIVSCITIKELRITGQSHSVNLRLVSAAVDDQGILVDWIPQNTVHPVAPAHLVVPVGRSIESIGEELMVYSCPPTTYDGDFNRMVHLNPLNVFADLRATRTADGQYNIAMPHEACCAANVLQFIVMTEWRRIVDIATMEGKRVSINEESVTIPCPIMDHIVYEYLGRFPRSNVIMNVPSLRLVARQLVPPQARNTGAPTTTSLSDSSPSSSSTSATETVSIRCVVKLVAEPYDQTCTAERVALVRASLG